MQSSDGNDKTDGEIRAKLPTLDCLQAVALSSARVMAGGGKMRGGKDGEQEADQVVV